VRLLNGCAKENPLQVFVRDNNVEQALKVLKKKLQREGLAPKPRAKRTPARR
jgi:small subunit ribosomal protein S21